MPGSATSLDVSSLGATFPFIRIVSLPERLDRRKAVRNTLEHLGIAVDGSSVAFFDAVRPSDPDGFPSIGARGCFMSHLTLLRLAQQADVETLLILEDDVEFSRSEAQRMTGTLAALAGNPWDIFYGGSPAAHTATPLSRIPPSEALQLTHFIAFSRTAIDALVPYLEQILLREPGSPDGGPMHVDGAYSWFRAAHPEIRAFAATPHIAHQRSSRTDIHALGGSDQNLLLRPMLSVMRSVKNALRHRS